MFYNLVFQIMFCTFYRCLLFHSVKDFHGKQICAHIYTHTSKFMYIVEETYTDIIENIHVHTQYVRVFVYVWSVSDIYLCILGCMNSKNRICQDVDQNIFVDLSGLQTFQHEVYIEYFRSLVQTKPMFTFLTLGQTKPMSNLFWFWFKPNICQLFWASRKRNSCLHF